MPWRLRLFDSLVVFQNYLVDETVLRWGTVEVEPLTAPEATNYPLTLTVTPGAEMDLKLAGQPNRFGPASLTMMLDGLESGPLEPGRTTRRFALRDPVAAAGVDEGHGRPRHGRRRRAPAVYLCRPGQRDRARGRRSLGGAVRGGPGGRGRQLLRSRWSLDPPRSRRTRGFASGSATTCPSSRCSSTPRSARSPATSATEKRRVRHWARWPSEPSCSAWPSRGSEAARGSGSRCPIQTPTTPRRVSRSSVSPAAFRERGTWTSSGRTSSTAARPCRSSRMASWTPANVEETAARRQPNYVRSRGILADVEMFDAAFFGITPTEAAILDPQQRVFLETAWEALETAGYDPRSFAGPDRRLRRDEQQHVLPRRTSSLAQDVTEIVGWLTTMMGNEKDYLATRVSYKLDLRGPALNVQTACSTSLVAVCSRGPEPAELPVRHGARGRRLGHAAAEARVPPSGGRDHVARRPLPTVRRGRRRHRLQQWRRDRGAEAAERCGRRRRHDLRRDQGRRHEQRRRGEGQLHGAERRRTCRGHRAGPGSCRDRSGDDLLRRGARHRHAARRSDRDRRADAGVSRRRSVGKRLLRDRLGQEQHRPSRRGRRRRRAHQDGARAAPQGDSPEPPFHRAEPEARSRRLTVPRRHLVGTVAVTAGLAAPRRRQLVRRRRHECPRGARGGAGARRAPVPRTPQQLLVLSARVPVGSRRGHVEAARPSRRPSGGSAGRRGVHAPDRPAAVLAPPGARGAGNRRGHRAARRAGSRDDALRREHRRRRLGRVPVPGTGRASGRHGDAGSTRAIPASAPMSTSAPRSCAPSSASTCATSSTRIPAAKRWRRSGSHRRRSPSPHCSSSSTRSRWRGDASGSSPTA